MINPEVTSTFCSIAEKLSQGATLITATKRLARESRKQFNLWQRERGKQAWESADILTFDSWIYRIWQLLRESLRLEGPENPSGIVLNSAQSREIWRSIIKIDIAQYKPDTELLWNADATAEEAMEAWRICNQWNIDIDACERSYLEDHRAFAKWARSYQKQCLDNNWIDPNRLINTIVNCLHDNRTRDLPILIFTGFDIFTAQQQQLIEVLQQNQVSISLHEPVSQNAPLKHYFEFDNESMQWLAAASWAKQKVINDDRLRLAIVVPNLGQSRDMIDDAFTQILCPNHLVNPNNYVVKPYHISLGKALSKFPIVDAAILLLKLYTNQPIPYPTISKLLLCPFLGGGEIESIGRSKLEFGLRNKLPYRLRLSELHQIISQWQTTPKVPILEQMLCDACEVLNRADHNQSYLQWSEQFLSWLKLFGWPGQRGLASDEHQARQAFNRELSNLASLDIVSNQTSASDVTACLLKRLKEQPFESESAEVNIEIVGVLESVGLEFDAIWFAGLNEKDWPPPIHKNAFIPGRLQQDHYYRASTTANSEQAKSQHRRLIDQCAEIVFSRHRFEDDLELYPSPLFAGPVKRHCAVSTTADHYQATKPTLEMFVDKVGLPIMDENPSGGAALITDQSDCPFRAYAKHRLGACDVRPNSPGLNAMDRGSLVHQILESVWAELQSSTKARSISDVSLRNIINQSIETNSRRYFKKSGCGAGFFKTQSQWLRQLLLEWFRIEQTRKQAFDVVAVENRQTLKIGGLVLNFTIDRIDQLADGTIVLIDYKTGQTSAIGSWIGARPKTAQLPLYALSLISNQSNQIPTQLSALVFAKVKLGECKYQGVSVVDSFIDDGSLGVQVPTLDQIRLAEDLKQWPALLAHWHLNLSTLAEKFRLGQAEVDPRDGNVCMYCDLHHFCRINEAGQNR